jgi:hypothetical protein
VDECASGDISNGHKSPSRNNITAFPELEWWLYHGESDSEVVMVVMVLSCLERQGIYNLFYQKTLFLNKPDHDTDIKRATIYRFEDNPKLFVLWL